MSNIDEDEDANCNVDYDVYNNCWILNKNINRRWTFLSSKSFVQLQIVGNQTVPSAVKDLPPQFGTDTSVLLFIGDN